MDTKALRQKILDLAIRGKLVPQDPNDEPASVLLERIRAQKQQLVREGKLKAKDIKDDTVIFVGEDNLHYEKFNDGTVKCIEDEVPFDVPEGWEWSRLSSFSFMMNGTSKRSGKEGQPTIVLRLADLGEDDILFSDCRTVTLSENEISKYGLKQEDILFIRVNGSKLNVGKSYLFSEKDAHAAFCDHIIRARVLPLILPELLCYYMRSGYVRQIIAGRIVSAAGQNTISQPSLSTILIPIAPYEEQVRQVEAIRVAVSSIRVIENNQDDLRSIIDRAKARILDLAIRGQLVSQNSDDEPAAVLLERIRAEKESLIKQGKIKRDKRESIIFRGEDNSYYEKDGNGDVICIDDDLPFDIPDGWSWCELQDCCHKEIKRGRSPKYAERGRVLSFAQKCNQKTGGINISLALCIDDSSVDRYADDEYMQDGDIVINSTGTGTLGRVGIYHDSNNPSAIPIVPDSHVTVVRVSEYIDPTYAYFFLKAMQVTLEKMGEGSTNQKELKPQTVQCIRLPLPPLAEQRAICKRVAKAFSYMDRIEADLL